MSAADMPRPEGANVDRRRAAIGALNGTVRMGALRPALPEVGPLTALRAAAAQPAARSAADLPRRDRRSPSPQEASPSALSYGLPPSPLEAAVRPRRAPTDGA
jgi:hypothetical protein